MNFRKIVSTILIAAMLFFAPSMIPARAVGAFGPCGGIIKGLVLLPTDTAFAQGVIPCPVPGGGVHVPTWLWVAMACPASIILSGAVANFRDNRQLTYQEAWTCGLLYWFSWLSPPPQKPHR
jgi:hypothetical protein